MCDPNLERQRSSKALAKTFCQPGRLRADLSATSDKESCSATSSTALHPSTAAGAYLVGLFEDANLPGCLAAAWLLPGWLLNWLLGWAPGPGQGRGLVVCQRNFEGLKRGGWFPVSEAVAESSDEI